MSKKTTGNNNHDYSEELAKIADLKIGNDNKFNETVVAIDDLSPYDDDNNKIFKGRFRNIKIDPITHVKRHYSPALPSPLSPISSGNDTPMSFGNDTPRSLASAGSVGSLSDITDKAIAPNKKIKKEHSFESSQEFKPDSNISFHLGRPPKPNKKYLRVKKGGKTKKRRKPSKKYKIRKSSKKYKI